jgi:hypothetical protein
LGEKNNFFNIKKRVREKKINIEIGREEGEW